MCMHRSTDAHLHMQMHLYEITFVFRNGPIFASLLNMAAIAGTPVAEYG